ncbi:zf-TFIIB domain-containing protein [Burkholderia ubonensis]|uniref:TFIIB-type zinc ribbon-containing protein n=1 Tax=Burkholderia ubonensis TaxID=101571 RepID=UPI00075A71F3|nr:zf-TFIIB domain-containing protein [Burkholderia ubonensis]KVT00115.1 hypothetical protein WK47_26765 [Burkholderia ubonensis]KVT12337.1 hypothetical protein WK46_04375 [Burkholderia ubonensis]KVT36912.1 hypothetical protein WK50_29245 [Burkholderia ubonensis]
MKCPVCKTPDLLIAERQSIEIDYCPACRGVWLDRGELDKLIARGDGDAPVHRDARAQRGHDDAWGRDRRVRDDDRRHEPHRRKKSVFAIFDFD